MLPIIIYGIGAAASAYVAKKGYDSYSESQKREEAQRRIEEEKEREESIARAEDEIKAFKEEWSSRFKSTLIIDSNVWMMEKNKKRDEFFESLGWVMEHFSSKVTIPSVQFDEIINLKDLDYNNPKSQRARRALTRIEHFQSLGLVDIIQIGVEAKKNAYADPCILEELVKSSASHSSMTLVSNDRELRVRAIQILDDKNAFNFKAITGEVLDEALTAYQANLKLIDPSVNS